MLERRVSEKRDRRSVRRYRETYERAGNAGLVESLIEAFSLVVRDKRIGVAMQDQHGRIISAHVVDRVGALDGLFAVKNAVTAH